jgi:hypothetical protein
MVTQQRYAEVLEGYLPNLGSALLTALPGFFDDLRATVPTDREAGPLSGDQATGADESSLATAASGGQMARARFILWLSGVATPTIRAGGAWVSSDLFPPQATPRGPLHERRTATPG